MHPAAGPLYPPPGSLVFNNYPPLSFYIVGVLGERLFGDLILAGRVVALTSLLACTALLALVVRRLGAGRRSAGAAGILMAVFACSFFRDYVAMDDPQWLGHALMLAGLAALLRTSPPTPGNAAVAALLVLAGGLVKHNLVALPLAVTLWLGLYHRRAVAAWLATAGAGLLLAAAAINPLYGPVALADILHHARQFQPAGMLKGAGRLLPLLPMAALSVFLLRRDPRAVLAGLFVAIACITGIAQRAGAGVAINAQFETLIAVCLAAGLALDQLPRHRGAVLATMALPILLILPKRLPNAWADLMQAHARAQSWQPTIARLAAAPGPVACETLALCYWAGKPFTLDLFNLTQSVRLHPPGPRLEFDLVQIIPHSPIHQRPDPIMAQLNADYAPAMTGPQGSVVLIRR